MLTTLCALTFLAHNSPASGAPRGSRRDEAGWTIVHLEGTPKEIGFQHGSLLSEEIDDAIKAVKQDTQGTQTWTWFRDTAKNLFWPKVDPEFQQEIEGIVEGLKSKGLKYDQWDILAENAHIELGDYYLPWLGDRASSKESCSAFVATGSATADGKPVIGHNMWWGYLVGQRWKIMFDIKPAKGHRFMMDALAGFIHSGSDFAATDAGLMITETTISGFKGFDPKGIPEFVRMRKATQYANSLDEWVETMKKGNNGGYANTWLLADTKTNEIGRLELGLKNVIFSRSKDGSFVGSNFPENQKLIDEEIPGGWSKGSMSNGCEVRKARWDTLLKENKGKVDAEKAKSFLADTYDESLQLNRASGSTLCGKSDYSGAVNTKVMTAGMLVKWQIWARMGFSDGSTMEFNGRGAPLLKDIPSQPWVLFSLQ